MRKLLFLDVQDHSQLGQIPASIGRINFGINVADIHTLSSGKTETLYLEIAAFAFTYLL
jgi:hypothetical protein